MFQPSLVYFVSIIVKRTINCPIEMGKRKNLFVSIIVKRTINCPIEMGKRKNLLTFNHNRGEFSSLTISKL